MSEITLSKTHRLSKLCLKKAAKGLVMIFSIGFKSFQIKSCNKFKYVQLKSRFYKQAEALSVENSKSVQDNGVGEVN
jgi:hypothetical protein